MTRFSSFALFIVLSFAGVILWSGYLVFVHDLTAVYLENGHLENLQALLLLLSILLFASAIVVNDEQERLSMAFCTALCIAFVLREIDVQRLDVAEVFKFIGAGVGRNVLLAAAFFTLLLVAARNVERYRHAGFAFAASRPGVLLLIGGGFLVFGAVFEELELLVHNTFFEESMELCGYCCILIAAIDVSFITSPAQLRRG